MVQRLGDASDAVIAYPTAVYAKRTLVNLFHPEPERLARHNYLTRGYLVQRDWLEAGGGFDEGPELDAYADHALWLRVAHRGDPVVHIRHVGIRLWPTNLLGVAPVDPDVTWMRLDDAATTTLA